ncbi:Werner syndrome-like exonuclease [Tanacetum coccineum]
MAFRSNIPSVTFDSTSSKYRVKYDGKIIETKVTDKASITEEWVDEILFAHANDLMVVVGVDVEWRPHLIRSMSNKSATLQLCIGTKCLILQLFYMDDIPQSLKNFLLSPIFTFVGVEVEDELLKLTTIEKAKKNVFTTTIGVFPSDISGFSSATCRWGNVSPATCRWGMVAGEYSSGIQSPAIIPSEDVGLTRFSVKQFVPR